ncbi:TauD/TfdA family dioxygenase [Nocardia sp. NPDC101769]|uniref:TauD/TfdA family dioxygenase n=1 Tax=Nocardia sp. NPDC101769 TaxID=3364333 RepID=UPI0037FB462C
MAFARHFGELEVHPFIPSSTSCPELVRFEKSAQVSGFENAWHHDVTWREKPSMGAVLPVVAPRRQGCPRRLPVPVWRGERRIID